MTNEVGYSDPSHFTHAFRKHTGLSPSDYRRQR
ncbi:helix-turn-helix domain-containing protein [Pseudomonas batumici]|nr:helix-turn-helix domain-containing protein [Pseudomonas batumici]